MLPSSRRQFTVMVNSNFASPSIRQPNIAWPRPSTGPQVFAGLVLTEIDTGIKSHPPSTLAAAGFPASRPKLPWTTPADSTRQEHFSQRRSERGSHDRGNTRPAINLLHVGATKRKSATREEEVLADKTDSGVLALKPFPPPAKAIRASSRVIVVVGSVASRSTRSRPWIRTAASLLCCRTTCTSFAVGADGGSGS